MGASTNIRNIVFSRKAGEPEQGEDIAIGSRHLNKIAREMLLYAFDEIDCVMQIDLDAKSMKDISEEVAEEIAWVSRDDRAPLDSAMASFVERFRFSHYEGGSLSARASANDDAWKHSRTVPAE